MCLFFTATAPTQCRWQVARSATTAAIFRKYSSGSGRVVLLAIFYLCDNDFCSLSEVCQGRFVDDSEVGYGNRATLIQMLNLGAVPTGGFFKGKRPLSPA